MGGMSARSCETCRHHAIEDRMGRPDHRCMRLITHKSGAQFRSTSCVFETDSLPLTYRVAGDKCGPERTHWEAKT
jgi:hypothetical protein